MKQIFWDRENRVYFTLNDENMETTKILPLNYIKVSENAGKVESHLLKTGYKKCTLEDIIKKYSNKIQCYGK